MDEQNRERFQAVSILNRRSLARAGLEIISIVLGVLLALAVSEWQENRNNTERTEAALRNVQAELEKNLKVLEFVHISNEALIERLNDNPASVDQEMQFLPALQISDSAWQTLGTAGLANFVDLELMITLSQTYSMIEVYRRTGYSLVDANMSVLATATATERGMDKIHEANLFALNFVDIFQLIVNIESNLIDAHRNALAALQPGKQG